MSRGRIATFCDISYALRQQKERCIANISQFQSICDLASVKVFEGLLRTTKEYQKSLLIAFDCGDPAPLFHFESRQYEVQKCHTDMSDNELEITIVRAINLRPLHEPQEPMNAWKTFVRAHFIPQLNEPLSIQSECACGVSPVYNFSKRVVFKSAAGTSLADTLKTKAVRVELLEYRGTLINHEKPVGAVSLKLEGLERECELHEAPDLMDCQSGRHAVGGRVEIHVRIRTPLQPQYAVEMRRETVLVIDRWIPMNRC